MARHYPIANEASVKPMIRPIKPIRVQQTAVQEAAVQESAWPKSLALVVLGTLFAAAGMIF